MRWCFALSLLAACGRIGFVHDDRDASTDAPLDDAGPDLAILSVPFGTPVAVPELLHPANDFDPSLSADGLEIYFTSQRASSMIQLFRATRPSVTSAWSTPVAIAELASAFGDTDPMLADDGVTLFFSSDRAGSLDLYVTTRPSPAEPFGSPKRIDELVLSDDEVGAHLAEDELTLYFHAGPSPAFDLYRAVRSSPTDAWGPPAAIAELASPLYSDSDPTVTAGGRVLVFTSSRVVGPDLDLWISTRPSIAAPWGTPIPLTELNTTSIDSSPWLSADLRTIYFTSERSGERAIYMATR